MDPNSAQDTGSAEFDFLDLPDDEIMNMQAPTPAPAVEPPADETPPPGEAPPEQDKTEESPADGSTPPAPAGEADADGAGDDEVLASEDGADPVITPPPADKTTPDKVENATAPKEETPPAAEADKTTAPKKEEPKTPTADEYKAFYDRLLSKPIKANGKEIQLQTPDEAEKLIQMGLNYTKKMQAMQPALRVVKMLENNGLMDEARLSHLIDISKGDSGAIQKLLADTKFDPMSADADQAAKYVPADHRVSPLEMSFSAVLEDVEQTPAGVELISEVHGQWDADSKRALFQKPEILAKLAEQKTAGLYAQISGEVDRLRALGQITPDVPFLQAYHAVGDMMHQQGRLVAPNAPTVAPPAVPVETREVAPLPKVRDTTQAKAAAAVRTAPSNPKAPTLDYLSMDDAEFAKQSAGRY